MGLFKEQSKSKGGGKLRTPNVAVAEAVFPSLVLRPEGRLVSNRAVGVGLAVRNSLRRLACRTADDEVRFSG